MNFQQLLVLVATCQAFNFYGGNPYNVWQGRSNVIGGNTGRFFNRQPGNYYMNPMMNQMVSAMTAQTPMTSMMTPVSNQGGMMDPMMAQGMSNQDPNMMMGQTMPNQDPNMMTQGMPNQDPNMMGQNPMTVATPVQNGQVAPGTNTTTTTAPPTPVGTTGAPAIIIQQNVRRRRRPNQPPIFVPMV